MKHGRSAQELAQEVMRQSAMKHDLHALTSALTMVPESVHGERGAYLAVKNEETYAINNLAHDQIGEHCGIPARFYDRLLLEHTDLLAQTVNRLMQAAQGTRLVRTLDGKVRAFLSATYRPLENVDLIAAVLPTIQRLGLDISSCEITDRRLYLKIVHPDVTRELAKLGGEFGDGAHNIVRIARPAGSISNSEVGQGAVNVQTGYFDGFCSNLAWFGEQSTRKHHAGHRHQITEGQDVAIMLTDETRAARDKATWLEVRDTVEHAFNPEQFNKLIDKVEGTMQDKITGNPVKVVELTAKKFGLTDSANILTQLIEGGSLTRFGLMNAVTKAAESVECYEVASSMERIGGKLIELPKSEWNELAKAA